MTKKRVKQELSVAQTLTAGILEQAALMRNYETILIQIQGRDCVAIEARYHRRCYLTYTKCLTRKPKIVGLTLYDKVFDEFCVQVIEKRIIQNNEVLLLSYLLRKFVSCVQAIEKIDVPYQATRLKKRIQDRYPQLVFHTSKTMNKGTLVYIDSMTAGDVADTYQDMSTLESQSEDERDDDDDDDDDQHDGSDNCFNRDGVSMTKNMYFTALEVRKLLTESKGVDSEWPPDSHDLTLSLARQSIPVKLYNFLAWCLGFSSDHVENQMVDISSSENAKVVSIAQDLIYAESNGKKQTHKSLALGMTVRQMTGSVRLLRILHGLGHTASTATVYRHDTALAILSSDGAGKEITIPRNIIPEAFTTIVWDNNDFNEETVSGKGTTHVANGIIVQNKEAGQKLGERISVSKKNRTIVAPETNIVRYTSKEKGTLCLRNESSEILLEEENYRHEQSMGRNADFLYLLSRKNASENGESLPGWTGLNTQIYKEIRCSSNIGYLPVIDAPVTDMSTINTLLRHSVSICQRLQVPEIVLVFDEAIYAKAQMIRWKHDEFKKRLVIRLGDFHTVMSFCSGISKIFKDAGLQVSIAVFCCLPISISTGFGIG